MDYYNFESIKKIRDFNEVKNNYGDTPFTLICFNNQTTKEILEYCLENGADLTIENKYGNTPFYYLKKYNPSLVPFVEEWLERKQNVTTTTKESNKSKVTIPKVIIGCLIIGGLYKFLKR